MNKVEFSQYLLEYRKRLGYTQDEMAKTLGLSRKTYYNYEKKGVISDKKKSFIISHLEQLTQNFESPKGTSDPELLRFINYFFKNKAKVENHSKFKAYMDTLKKEGIIDYQRSLLNDSIKN